MANFTFGSDPEFMVLDADGKHRSAIGIIHGTKEDKVPLGGGAFAFYDNVLAEVNVKASRNKTEAIKNFRNCFKKLTKLVGDFRVKPQASQIYDIEECQHPDSQIFGCEPEYCIYTKDEDGLIMRVEPPILKSGNTFRSAGGHIHIGHDLCIPMEGGLPGEVVQMLDVFVGVPSVCMDHDPTSAARRKLYGGAGTHRIKMEYGLEYRSLSNFWLASPALVNVIYDLVDTVLNLVETGDYQKVEYDPKQVQTAINKGDKKTSQKILSSCQKWIPTEIYNEVLRLCEPQTFDFYAEWKI